MNKLSRFIVEKRGLLLVLFLLLTVAGIILGTYVKVNYDMTVYLPEESETIRGVDIINDEFGENGKLTVMISNVSLNEAYNLKKQIEGVENVVDVVWFDTAILAYKNTFMPNTDEEEFINFILNAIENNPTALPQEFLASLSNFYKDDNALFQVTFTNTAFDITTINAINNIKEIALVNMAGPSATAYAMRSKIHKEITTALIFIVPLLLLILFIATTSYFEPILFIIVIGISIIINMGSNIIFGSISYLTNSIAMLLQVAISMDYFIFYLHSYKAERNKGNLAIDSAKLAFKKSFSAVSASSLTTIAGFIALMFMRYKLGFDLGIVLAKGILISLITVFFFMPGFIVLTSRLIEKTEHKSLFNIFHRKKNETTNIKNIQLKKTNTLRLFKIRFVLPILLITLSVFAYFAQVNNQFLYGEMASAGGEGSDLQEDRLLIEKTFGSQNNIVVLLNKNHSDKEMALSLKLMGLENISSVQSYSLLAASGLPVPEYMKNEFLGDNYSRIIIVVNTDEESDIAFKVADSIRETVKSEVNDGYYLLGSIVSTQELKEINYQDYYLVTLLTLVLIVLILIITLKSFMLPIILALVIQTAIWTTMSIPNILNQPLIFLGYMIVSCVQMGSTIDYGILLSTNYVENRKEYGKYISAKKAFKSSIGAVTTSAIILTAVGFSVGISGSTPAVSSIGTLLGRGTIVSYILMMFILPLLLVIFDRLIQWSSFKRKEYIKE